MSEREKLKISTRVMYDELLRQGAPVEIVDADSSLLEYIDTSGESRLLFSTLSDKSSSVGSIVTRNKIRGEIIAKRLSLPLPLDTVCDSYEDAERFLEKHQKIVVKPTSSSGGNGVSTGIINTKMLRIAYDYAREFGDEVITQQHIEGSDIRLLVIAGTFRSAVERRPASVVGDGKSTIRQLIDIENNSGRRADNSMQALSLINLQSAQRYLDAQIDTIIESGVHYPVVGPANLSLGGTAHEATHLVSSAMISDAEKIANKLGLAICGVDMMWDKKTNDYHFIEVNGTPGVNMHNDPFWGTKSNAIELYVEWLLDPTKKMRV